MVFFKIDVQLLVLSIDILLNIVWFLLTLRARVFLIIRVVMVVKQSFKLVNHMYSNLSFQVSFDFWKSLWRLVLNIFLLIGIAILIKIQLHYWLLVHILLFWICAFLSFWYLFFVFTGPLLAHIQERIHFTEHEASLVIRDVANALKWLHQKGKYRKLSISTLQDILDLHLTQHLHNTSIFV